jgi:hypothetical protein
MIDEMNICLIWRKRNKKRIWFFIVGKAAKNKQTKKYENDLINGIISLQS